MHSRTNACCRLFTKATPPHRPILITFGRRYGPYCLLAAATAGALYSPLSPFAVRPIHNDASNSGWLGFGGKKADAEKKDKEAGGASGQQAPPPQSRVVTKDGETTAEEKKSMGLGLGLGFGLGDITSGLSSASESISSFGGSAATSVSSFGDSATTSISSLGDTIVEYVVPKWAKLLPALITKLQNELSMAPGSLAEQIWYEANDPEINPEIVWDASVRVSNDLCEEELRFLQKRQMFTRRGLARYLDIPEDKIHPDDVPIIAMCGSGGGLRALVAGASSYLTAQEHGLFDCVTYTAGVSGSCWLQTLYYSSTGQRNYARVIRHLKNRLGVHIAYPPDALELVASAPTNKHLLSGLVEKLKGIPDSEFGIVDIYGMLLAARLLVPKGALAVDEYDFKVSNQRRYTDNGSHPLPIYTAIRHEIPLSEQSDMKDPIAAEAKARREAWFQWFE